MKKPPEWVDTFWSCICGTGTLAGDSDFSSLTFLDCVVIWSAAALGCKRRLTAKKELLGSYKN